MMLCLVTDRRRLSPGLPLDRARRRLLDQVARAVEDGIDFVLVRERDLEAAALASLVRDLVQISRSTRTRIIVNDRLDVALVSGADGVHLRGDSMSAAAVRRIAADRLLVGRSVHSVQDAREAGPVDYLIAGTVFPTPSKPADGPLLGLEGLTVIAQTVDVPVLAIGGVTEARLDDIVAAGAAGAAAIGLFINRFDRPESPA